MIDDNAIPHCGLELGLCSRQIPYNMLAHDKIVHKDAYQQGRVDERAKAIHEMKDLIINTPSKMVINGQDYFSDFELSMMLKKLKEQSNE